MAYLFDHTKYDMIHLMRRYADQKNSTYCGIKGFELLDDETGVLDPINVKFVTCDRCKELSAMYLLSRVA